MDSVLGKSIGRVRSAAKGAFRRNKHLIGGNKDNQLRIYDSMKPQDFNALAELYGGDGVIRYIRYMEAKRLSNGGSNG